MEYLFLNDYPHIKSRHERLRIARRADDTWSALFKTKGYKRMKVHAAALGCNFTHLIGKAFNLPDDDELFTVVHSTTLGYIVLARGKVDVE